MTATACVNVSSPCFSAGDVETSVIVQYSLGEERGFAKQATSAARYPDASVANGRTESVERYDRIIQPDSSVSTPRFEEGVTLPSHGAISTHGDGY